MKLTLQVRVVPSTEDAALLLRTMERFNEAATFAARAGFDAGVYSQPSIHKLVYFDIRKRFDLSAQMAVRAIGKAVEVFARDKRRSPIFKPHGAVTYDERILSWKGLSHVSLWTMEGRRVLPFVCGEYQRQRFDRLKGQVDLVYRDRKFYLYATIEIPESAPIDVKEFVGVDLGVANLATTSDGQRFSGISVERVRQRHYNGRRSLGRKTGQQHKRRTRKNARRAARRLGRHEARFRKHENHCISKTLVIIAKDTSRGLALEELTGIRERTRFRRSQRARVGGWAFAQLRAFVTYKAWRDGVPLVVVDPRNTSRTCAECGHCEEANRLTQAEFHCRACGHVDHADTNAARNIATRGAEVVRPGVSQRQRTIAA